MLAARALEAVPEQSWEARREVRATKVRAKRVAPARPMVRVAAVAAVIAALLLAYVGEQAIAISLSYQLGDLKTSLHQAQVNTDRLQLKMSELSSLGRIEDIARNELKMTTPDRMAYLDTPVPQTAAAVDEKVRRVAPTGMARIGSFLQGLFTSVARAQGK